MRIPVTGSRAWRDSRAVHEALNEVYFASRASTPVVLVHGACPTGADAIAGEWVLKIRAAGWEVTEERHPAGAFGPWPACGPRRNQHMVNLGADVCVAFVEPCVKPNCEEPKPHDSHGTAGTVKLCKKAGIPVKRVVVP